MTTSSTVPSPRLHFGLAPLLALLVACHASFETAAPDGFVELEQAKDGYDFRATTPEGLVVAAREIDHEPRGSIAFWTRALEVAMRQRGGYALLDTRELSLQSGLVARQLRFGHDEGSRPHLYYVSVVVTDDTLYLLEAGGSKALVEREDARITTWMQGFRAERCAPFPLSFACLPLSRDDQPRDDEVAPTAGQAAEPPAT